MYLSVAVPAAHARGLPPKVLVASPFLSELRISALVTVAPMGTPPASPLATVMMSGTTPQFSMAQSFPVLPSPVCISSAISKTPFLSQISRTPRRKPFGGSTIPPSPWMGSTITAPMSASISLFEGVQVAVLDVLHPLEERLEGLPVSLAPGG